MCLRLLPRLLCSSNSALSLPSLLWHLSYWLVNPLNLSLFTSHLTSTWNVWSFSINLPFLIKDNADVLPASSSLAALGVLYSSSTYSLFVIHLISTSFSPLCLALAQHSCLFLLCLYTLTSLCASCVVATRRDVSQLVPLHLCVVTSSCSGPITNPSLSKYLLYWLFCLINVRNPLWKWNWIQIFAMMFLYTLQSSLLEGFCSFSTHLFWWMEVCFFSQGVLTPGSNISSSVGCTPAPFIVAKHGGWRDHFTSR